MPTPQKLLRELASIPRMERGKLCRMREGPSGPYFNHQTWENGRNVVRYVPREQVAALQHAIANYRRFLRLTQAYADAIIRQTRARPPPLPPARLKRRRP
jgi:hypothetical protein